MDMTQKETVDFSKGEFGVSDFARMVFACVFTILLVKASLMRLAWIGSSSYPLSSDAFFYLQEFSHRLSTGEGYYTAASPFFSFFTLVAGVLGTGELGAFYVVLYTGFLLFSFALVGFSATKGDWWFLPGLLYAFLNSDILFYRHYAFLKQGVSIGFFAYGLMLLSSDVTQVEEGMRRVIKFMGLLLLLLSALLHPFTAVLSSLILIAGGKELGVGKLVRWVGAAIAGAASVYLLIQHPRLLFNLAKSTPE